jgi:hypothetical protein
MQPSHTRYASADDESYLYQNDATENSGLNDDEEDFVYSSTSFINAKITPKTQPSVNDTKRRTVISSKDAVKNTDFKDYIKYEKQAATTRRWQWGFCVTTTFSVFLILGCSAFLIYNLFFTTPYVYIDQVQLSHVPIRPSRMYGKFDKYVGFRITLMGHNNNFADVTLQDVKLTVTIRDAGTSSGVGYLLDTPIERKYNSSNEMILKKRSTTRVVINSMIDLEPSPNYNQIQELINNSQFNLFYVELHFEGSATSSIGILKYSHKLLKRQQSHVKIKS